MKRISNRSARKLIVFVNLFLIFALMVVSVYSWFVSRLENQVDAYDITVAADDALELSFDGVVWGGSLNLADLKAVGGNTKVLDSMRFTEVTGDGETFLIPQLTQQSNYAAVDTDGTWRAATANEDYLEFTVHMRSKNPLNVYLSAASAASPVASVLTGAGCGNPSSYSTGADAFSKDLIVGALRVSFENAANSRYIWIPKPQYHLNNFVGSSSYSADINATDAKYTDGTGNVGASFFWNNPFQHYYYNNTQHTTETYSNTLTSLTQDASDSTQLAALNAKVGDYYTGDVTFRIWIEGCDTEARRALMGGSFNLSLVFDSYAITGNG